MLICHKLVVLNEAAVLQACHVSDVHAWVERYIGSVYHSSVVSDCVPLSASSSLIYNFWSLKHHHSAATHHHHHRCERQLSYQWKLHACRANNYFLLFFARVFGIARGKIPVRGKTVQKIVRHAGLKGVPILKKICLLFSWEKNILNKQYVLWGLKHSLFLDFFCKTKKTICTENTCFMGPCRKCIFYNFADKAKFMILFHLQILGA